MVYSTLRTGETEEALQRVYSATFTDADRRLAAVLAGEPLPRVSEPTRLPETGGRVDVFEAPRVFAEAASLWTYRSHLSAAVMF